MNVEKQNRPPIETLLVYSGPVLLAVNGHSTTRTAAAALALRRAPTQGSNKPGPNPPRNANEILREQI